MVDDEFVALVARHLKYAGPESVTGQSRLRDLGLDSMRAIELLFAVEETYGVMIPDELLIDHTTFETPDNLWSAIQTQRGTVPEGAG